MLPQAGQLSKYNSIHPSQQSTSHSSILPFSRSTRHSILLSQPISFLQGDQMLTPFMSHFPPFTQAVLYVLSSPNAPPSLLLLIFQLFLIRSNFLHDRIQIRIMFVNWLQCLILKMSAFEYIRRDIRTEFSLTVGVGGC